MTVQVKICGLKDAESVQAAVSAGADFMGFVDYPKSPRHIIPTEAAKLMTALPSHVSSVLVTVNPTDEWIDQINFHIAPHYIQLHGDESAGRVREIKKRLHEPKIIKAISVCDAADIKRAEEYEDCADMLLFDTKVAGLQGGSGTAFDWSLLAGKNFPLPWILSGGLTSDNIAEAIRITGAAMVDVSSGVESVPGVKDARRIKHFINAAKQA